MLHTQSTCTVVITLLLVKIYYSQVDYSEAFPRLHNISPEKTYQLMSINTDTYIIISPVLHLLIFRHIEIEVNNSSISINLSPLIHTYIDYTIIIVITYFGSLMLSIIFS